jgi:iron complex outermembrane receptor protein
MSFKSFGKSFGVGSGILLAAGSWAHSAHAEDAAPGATLEEIVVTAEKREENIQKTPIAVQVVTPEELAEAGVRDFTQMDKISPDIQVFQGAGATVISIRGLRSTSYDPTDESPNAVHIDGAYIARANSINGLFYDIARVEVLAGPQGTLYGRNSASGAINIITNKPGSTFGATGSLELGDYNLVRMQAALNAPLSDTFAVRIAGTSYQHSGYADSGLDDARQQGGRVEALWKPSDRQSLLVTGETEITDPKGPATAIVAVNPALQGANQFTVPNNPRDDRQIDGTQSLSYQRQKVLGASLQYDYHFEPVTFTLQAAHREFSQEMRTITNFSDTYAPERSVTNSLEMRLTSNSTRPLQYVGGLFFFQEKARGFMQAFVSPTNHTEASRIDLEGQKTTSAAAFGQLTWTPAAIDALHLTLGGRYNYDKKSASSKEVIVPIVNFTSPYQTKSWSKYTWKAGVAYDLSDQNMVYANVSTGYKSGGFTYGATPVTPPQTITAYEVGTKNRFFSDRLQVNLDAFKYDYKNFEQTFLDVRTFPFVLDVATAGSADIKGASLSVLLQATRDDNFNMSVSYLDTRYGDFNLAAITGIPNQPNLTGYPLPNTPHWTANAGYSHGFRINTSTLTLAADVQFGGHRVLSLPSASSPQQTFQGAYAVEDVVLRFEPSDNKWSMSLYCNNVGNRVYYYTSSINTPPGPLSGTTTASLSPPRTIGAIFSVTL